MIRAALLSLALTGSVAWEERQETYAGITCPTLQDAQFVASHPQMYMLGPTLARTNCQFVAFQGRTVGETADFNIGSTLFSFLIVESEGHRVYVLENKGEGYTA